MHERLPAHTGSVARLRHAVVRFAGRSGASVRRREDIALAVSEALTNVVLHAYDDRDRPGHIDVRASLSDGALVIVVRDEGVGLVRRVDSPGRGLGLIEQLTDRLELVDGSPGLSVRMTFRIA